MLFATAMKRPTLLALAQISLILAAGAAFAATTHAAEDSKIPAPILKGLEAYKSDGFAGAADVWIKNSVLDGNAAAKGQLMALTEVERFFGKYEGHELLRVVRTSSRTQRLYIVLYYEKGPLWSYFDIYEMKNGVFMISELLFNTKAAIILPPDVYYRR